MREYPQVHDGEWVWPKRAGYRLQCCDCGLVHTFDFRLVKHGNGRKIQFRAFRNVQETEAVRSGNRRNRQILP